MHGRPSSGRLARAVAWTAVAAAPVDASGRAVEVTVSVGWAHWAGDTPSDLLARADHALYQAKDAGRDTVRPSDT